MLLALPCTSLFRGTRTPPGVVPCTALAMHIVVRENTRFRDSLVASYSYKQLPFNTRTFVTMLDNSGGLPTIYHSVSLDTTPLCVFRHFHSHRNHRSLDPSPSQRGGDVLVRMGGFRRRQKPRFCLAELAVPMYIHASLTLLAAALLRGFDSQFPGRDNRNSTFPASRPSTEGGSIIS